MGAQASIAGLLGLILIGLGVRVLARGEPPVIKATGRAWRSASEAAVFWFLLALAVLTTPIVWAANTVAHLGPDAAFWLLVAAFAVALPAVTWFRPRKTHDQRAE